MLDILHRWAHRPAGTLGYGTVYIPSAVARVLRIVSTYCNCQLVAINLVG